jgi:hypothetical protein
MSEVAETNPIQDLIQNAIDQDFNKANNTFNDIMTIKMSDLLDQEKIRIADQMYNGVEDEEDDGQLDLDLDGGDEESSEGSSEDQDTDEEDAGADDETEDEFEETEEE